MNPTRQAVKENTYGYYKNFASCQSMLSFEIYQRVDILNGAYSARCHDLFLPLVEQPVLDEDQR